jgi:hypothetical protein
MSADHALAMFGCFAIGLGAGGILGLLWGRQIWAPKWWDTSEGINRKFREMGLF